MAHLPTALNGDDAPANEFEPIEPGSYNAQITASNGKAKDGGLYVVGLQFQVLDGPMENRTFWMNFNFLNPKSAMNQEIAQKQLKQIAKACGVSVFEQTEDLHGRPLNITVKINEHNGYRSNQMSSVREYQQPGANGSVKPAPSKPAGNKAPAKAAAGAGGASRPWGPK